MPDAAARPRAADDLQLRHAGGTPLNEGPTTVSANYEKLRGLLQELFQLDQADLDFGIYRIMNQKRDEIVRFLDHDLLPQVKQAFSHYQSADRVEHQKELDKLVQTISSAGMNPDDSPKVKDLKAKLADNAVDVTALENEVFSHLFNFFRRYYSEGDFISLRRYKEGVYAIPYEGEEVKLHWANADQYYVKSTEYFRDYTFTMPSGKRVRVHLVAASTEQDNKKEAAGKERRFMLCSEDALCERDGELFIRFEYRLDDGKKKQDVLNKETLDRVFTTEGFDNWIQELQRLAPTEKNPSRTLLEKHLTQYTARNAFDYFIHKDLGSFLRRELDFYIKNEVMHLDDIEHESAPRVEQYLSQIKVIRLIAGKVVQFLEQLENFQKKLWLKKKFVVETHYCITLDRVPEELLPEIANNKAQREAWVQLFAIDEIAKTLHAPAYSEPLTVEFLKSNLHLTLDTAFFPQDFKDRLLRSLDNLDDSLNGLLVHSENHQALALLAKRYHHQIGVLFADPPYNTGVDGFPYKDSYQHSSWLTMMENRLLPARTLLAHTGLLFLTIDFVEVSKLRLLCDSLLGPDNFLADIAWEKRYTRSNNAKRFYSLKDTVLCYRASPAVEVIREARSEKSKGNYTNPDNDPRGPWISSSYVNPATKEQRPNLVYAIRNPITEAVVEHPTHAWKYDPDTHKQHVADKRLYWGPDGSYEFPRLKSFLSEAKEGMVPIDVWHYKDTGTTDDGGKTLKSLFGTDVFDNPKPITLVQRAVGLSPDNPDSLLVLDHFAGSGTTGQAVIALNREDEGKRKYMLVEMGTHFDTVLRPRIQKVIYSHEWESGKPSSRLGTSHAFKYMRLESYEDALGNLELRRTTTQEQQLFAEPALREQYTLSYMLDAESRGSQSLLNVDGFRNPDQYKLKVERNGETELATVDLVETFNWLLGLTIKHIDLIRGVRVVEGMNPEGERVLVLWRNVDETDNDKLDEWFEKQGYSTRDLEYDLIYVNGDNNLENLRRADQTWKVRLIEDEFGQLMFQ
jgi:adenine-specific DNA-methyltransferase